MPFNIEITDIILIIVVALILFGPSKLPEISRGLGKGIVEFRNSIRGMSDGFRQEIKPPGNKEIADTPFISQSDQSLIRIYPGEISARNAAPLTQQTVNTATSAARQYCLWHKRLHEIY